MSKKKAEEESPLMRKLPNGQIQCIICSMMVKSEKLWRAHVLGRQHIQKIQELKNNVANNRKLHVEKNSAAISKPPPEKKLKKDSSLSFQNEKPQKSSAIKIQKLEPQIVRKTDPENSDKETEDVSNENTGEEGHLPTGFFDDPKLDKKMRGIDEKEAMDQEWNRFQREIQQVEQQASTLIEEEEEQISTVRFIEEANEQIQEWSRVQDLQDRKDEAVLISTTSKSVKNADEDYKISNAVTESSIDDFEEIDNLMNWRHL